MTVTQLEYVRVGAARQDAIGPGIPDAKNECGDNRRDTGVGDEMDARFGELDEVELGPPEEERRDADARRQALGGDERLAVDAVGIGDGQVGELVDRGRIAR